MLFTKLKVSIHYKHVSDDDSFKIVFRALFGLIKYKMDVPLIKIDDDSPTAVIKSKVKTGQAEETKKEESTQISAENLLNSIKDVQTLLNHVVSLHKIIQHFLKKVKVTQFEWKTMIGTGDAASTGMISGAVWAVKGSIIGIISHYCQLHAKPELMVQPHFQFAVSQTMFTCMLQFRIGHAMIAGIKLFKFWKGGIPRFKSKPLSALSQGKTKTV